MSTNFKTSQLSSPIKAKANEFSNSFDFERWANAVRPQLLAALQKRAGYSQRNSRK
jgi:hypothetical protein